MLNRAFHAVALTIGLHRVDCVVVGRPRRKVTHADAENGIVMGRVQPDGRFRGLGQAVRTPPIVDDSVMFRRSPRIVAGPRDNRQIAIVAFEFRPLRDLHVVSFFDRRTHLSGG